MKNEPIDRPGLDAEVGVTSLPSARAPSAGATHTTESAFKRFYERSAAYLRTDLPETTRR